MATINVSFDTVSKSMSVTMDGNEVANAVGVHLGRCYSYNDDECKHYCDIMTVTKDKENKTETYTRISANEDGSGFIQTAVAGVIERVASFLRGK